MPITGSLGALTYAKFGASGQLANYWIIKNNADTNNTPLSYFDSANESVYLIGSGIYSVRITGFGNPQLSYSNFFTGSQYIIGSPQIYSIKGLTFFGAVQTEYRPASPYYNVIAGLTGSLVSSTGGPNILQRSYPYYGGPPSGDNQLVKVYNDGINSGSDWFVVGHDTDYLPAPPPGPQNQFRTFPAIWKYNSSFTKLAYQRFYESYTGFSSSFPFWYQSSICLDSSGNPIISYGFRPSTSTAKTNIVLRKVDKTPSGVSPNEELIPIWQVGLVPTSNQLLGCVGLLTDSAGNIYGLYRINNSATSYIVKYDSTGTVLWQKTVNEGLGSILLKSDTEIYVSGGSTNLYIAKLDDTGAVLFERNVTSVSGPSIRNNIHVYNNNMFISCNGKNGCLVKLPDDGTIPAATFSYNTGETGTYASTTRTWSTSSMTSFSPVSTATGSSDQTVDSIGISSSNVSISRSVAFI